MRAAAEGLQPNAISRISGKSVSHGSASLRRLVLACALPLLLAACDQSPSPPQSDAQAESAAQLAAPVEPAPNVDLAPLLGRWAADLRACDTPIVISETRFEGAENVCDITEFAESGDGAFTVSMTCTGEGQTVSERIAMTPIFGPTGEGIRLDYLDRGGEPVAVFRCKAPRTAPAGQ